MYFLNTIVLLSSTLTAAHDGTHNTATLTPSTLSPSPSPSLSTQSSSVRQTKTVIVTLTHTILPSTTILSLAAPTKSKSGFAIPPSPPPIADAGEAGTAYTCTKPESCTVSSDPLGLPIVTRSGGLANGTRAPMFTLDATTVLYISHYTPSKILSTTTKSSPTFSVAVSGSPSSWSYTAPTSTSSFSGADVTSSLLPFGNNIPVSVSSGFQWPVASTLPATDSHDDGKVAWAGTDNAIASQMQDLPPSDSSHPMLQSKRAEPRRVQKFWRDSIRKSPLQEAKTHHDTVEESRQKRGCRHCDQEGTVLCRGDVAIGICRGGCMEMQMIGRGKGNGCEDS